MTNQLYQLVVRKGPRPGQIFPLELDLLTVGRDPLSDIVLEDPEVSRHHASLTQSDEGYLLQDKGSTNGSFVDGQRLGGDPVPLKPGQVVMFGSTVTLVYQATPLSDPLATMVAPAVVDEVEEPEEAAVVEEPAVDVPPAPALDDVEPAPDLPVEVPEPLPEFEEPVEAIVEEIPAEPEVPEMFEESAEVEEIALPESQPFLEEDDDAMATMIEDSPVIPAEEPVEPEPLPAFTFDDPEPEPTPMPVFDEPEPDIPAVPAYDEAVPDIELPSEPPPLAPLPTFEEPEPVIESPGFAYEQEDAGEIVDSAAPMLDEEAAVADSPSIQTTGEIVDDAQPDNRNRNIIIGVVAALVLCCLCIAVISGGLLLFGPG